MGFWKGGDDLCADWMSVGSFSWLLDSDVWRKYGFGIFVMYVFWFAREVLHVAITALVAVDVVASKWLETLMMGKVCFYFAISI